MAGYDGFSMSNNARLAYRNGLKPASKISGIPSPLVAQFCRAEEWHHTSSKFNVTNFYSEEKARVIFGLDPESEDVEAVFNQAAAAAALAASKAPKTAEVLTGRTVKWIDWVGSFKHTKAIKRVAEDCVVEVKGAFATITTADGLTFKKKIGANGFSF